MGILDDAIREHLDLKRRQGAADSEIQRLESEAFGPPSRPGEPDFPQTGEEQAVGDEAATATAEPAPEPALDEPAESAASESAFFDQTHDEPPPEAPGSAAPEPPEAQPQFDLDDPAAHLETLSEPAAPEPSSEPPIESLDTVEHHFEGAIEDTGEAPAVAPQPGEQPLESGEEPTGEEPVGGEGEEEDVLEETPEFLRDQPEDDELWFEQGEPKDFDF